MPMPPPRLSCADPRRGRSANEYGENLIVDDRARGVFRVNRRAFTDPEILEQERRAVLDLESVRPHGKLSFIL